MASSSLADGKRQREPSPELVNLLSDDEDSSPYDTPSKRSRTTGPSTSPQTPFTVYSNNTPSPTKSRHTDSTEEEQHIEPAGEAHSAFPEITNSYLADQYIPKTSTAEGVEYVNPKKFCLKPVHIKAWDKKHYVLFAEYLRQQFDPREFAAQTGLTIEEINYVFTGIVVNPLYDAKQATKRGDDYMEELRKEFRDSLAHDRPWGKPKNDESMIEGRLSKISNGGDVEIITTDGGKVKMARRALSEIDLKYLEQTLTEKDAKTIFGDRD
jgi:hypothetical protein